MILGEVKKRLGIADDSNDDALTGLIDDVKAYAASAGISDEVLDSDKAYGLITRGVSDLWADNPLSDVFKMRLVQLQMESVNHGN